VLINVSWAGWPGVRPGGPPKAEPGRWRRASGAVRRRLDEAGLPGLHLHDLRHTGNTMAAATGASLRELMERMGHTSTRAALIYQHATRERDEAIAAAMGEVLASVRRKGPARSRSGTYRARRKGTAS
jgi:integrase